MRSVRQSSRSSVAQRTAVAVVALFAALSQATVSTADEPISPAAPDAAAGEFFEKQVRPILIARCYECHSAEDPEGGLALDSKAGVAAGGDTGAPIVPGNPEKSLLVQAIRYGNRDLQMPPKNRLPDAEIATLEKWVAMGAPDPREAAPPPADTKSTAMSVEEGRKFRSFVSPVEPPLPTMRDVDWTRTPIDRFILAKLEERGLTPAPEADRQTLIRRLTYDLIGLPPTPDEVDRFLADESPDAYERLVDRLLASPRYGVRWGRKWLDVARYADSNGLDENLAFGNAWRFRDYVVDSFNDDKPYDQFLIEQIAGDLLPEPDREALIATGFLALGAKVLAEPDRAKLEMDVIDEQIDTLGKAFLGLTLGCARCHDHKFDPVLQSDYYALAAIFKSTKSFGDGNTGAIKHWYERSFATEAELAAIKEVDARIAEKKAAAASFKSAAVAKLKSDARAKAADYLAAAARFEPDASLTQIALVAEPQGLHPRILHHCRLHLEYGRDDPLFRTWHELKNANDEQAAVAAIEEHYLKLFAEIEPALAAAKAKDPAATTIPDERLERARLALNDAAGFLAVPEAPEAAFDGETLAEYHRLLEEARLVESAAPDAPAAMGVAEGTVADTIPIHIRGSHLNLGEPVARSFPVVLRKEGEAVELPTSGSGRLELARWMAGDEHPLTYRVFVNRIWRGHFGVGLVGSTENFGAVGDLPSHPELLDLLAIRFVRSGKSTKELHRLIVTSNVYRMASVRPDDAEGFAVDPENRLLRKFPMQRLEAEQIRDAILAVSGRLDESLGGKSIPLRNMQFVFDHTSIDHTKYDSVRRSIYLPIVRNNVYSLFEQFDFPDPATPTGNRNSTVVAPQALLLMNSDLAMDSAQAMADRLLEQAGDDAARIDRAYRIALARPATERERERAEAFLVEATAESDEPSLDAAASKRRAWALFCQSLFAANEFIYVR